VTFVCGFVAIYENSEKRLDPKLLEAMTSTMRYRGPDDYGFGFIGPETHCLWREKPPAPIGSRGVAMGHRRLSILDLSVAGRQPFVSRDNRFWMVYNGEIYNYLELRAELVGLGYTFRTSTDTEVLLTAYEHWGPACFNRLNGMWASVIWDNERQTLVACRDRFGIKPLYYHNVKGDWIFASEVKAILKHPDAERKPNPKTVFYYMSELIPPTGADTFFHNIKSVEPGTYLTLCQGQIVEVKRYWKLPNRPWLSIDDLDEAVEKLSELLTDAIKLRLRADVRIGTMLSGGMDSTSVIRTINELLLTAHGKTRQAIGPSLQAFNASFPGTAIDESERVDEFCQDLGITVHKVFPMVERDVEELFRSVVYYMEMPFINCVHIVHTLLMRRARSEGIKVVLNGQGPDEMLGGYPSSYCQLASADELLRFHWRQGYNEIKAMESIHRVSWKKAPLSAFWILSPPSLTTWYAKMKSRRDTLFRRDARRRYPPSHWAIRHRNSPGRTALDRALKREFFQEVLPPWLHMEDRASMSASVESRLPFLDYRLVEFGFALDNSLKIRNGTTKYVLRETMKNRLPASIVLEPRKFPFSGPDVFWLTGPLKPLLLFTLGQGTPMVSDFIEPQELNSMISHFLNGDQQKEKARLIWTILNTEMWMRTFF
jgi:asparagine synthase (glutamine-hydrolysing)